MSENRERALRDWESYWILLVYFYVAYGLWSHRVRRATYWVLFVSTTLSSLVALIQCTGGIDIFLLHIPEQQQASSTLYIMTFAGMVAMLVTVNFAVIFHRGRVGRLETFAGGGLVLQLVGLLLTHTRGAWVALAAGLGVATVLLRKRSCFIVAAVLVVVVAVFAATNQRVRGKIVSIPRSLREAPDVNVATRYVLWDVSWEMIKRHPVLGVGMGDFSTEAEKLAGERHTETVTDAHNVYLHVFATRGLVGFLPFVLFWVVMLRTLWRARKSAVPDGSPATSFAGHFTTGVFAAAITLLVGALTENNIDDSEIFTAFMLLAGLAKSFSLYPDTHQT
jgi:O-antigen ligase